MEAVSNAAPFDDDDDDYQPDTHYEVGAGVEVVRGEIVEYDDTGWTRNGKGKENHRYKFDDLKKAMYLNLIRQGVRRIRAAEYVGVSYATVQEHFLRFPEFLEAVSEAEMFRVDMVEEALYETAIAGNVVAQQVVLFNRRPEEWADQRMMRARIEAAAANEESRQRNSAQDSLGGLREKLGELRERLVDDDNDGDTDLLDDLDDQVEYERVHLVGQDEADADESSQALDP